ncbi:C39 family peptidase [Sulfoacidibacillus ferrooxidans]|uniref:Peptidase C39-like domain-containing protein n=1 Tax=Sulfoacidibacillus ferrooxidans TaxID=2005001 RepID=A0A9X2AAW5_9BACL|nr:hypothetical protein [Sulfoacidibacillus ferrooxidans]
MRRKWLTYMIVVVVTLGSAAYITSAFASSTNPDATQWMDAGDMMTELTAIAVPSVPSFAGSTPYWDVLQSGSPMGNIISFDRDNGWLDHIPTINSYTFSVSQPFSRGEAASMLTAMFGITLHNQTPMAFATQAGWFQSMPHNSYFTVDSAHTFIENVKRYVAHQHMQALLSPVGWADLHRAPLTTEGGFMAGLQYTVTHLSNRSFSPASWLAGLNVDSDQTITAGQAAQWLQVFAEHENISRMMDHLDMSPYMWATQLSLFHATGITSSAQTLTAVTAQQILNNLSYLLNGNLPNTTGVFLPMPRQVILPVKSICQMPELPNGCEVTSLSILLQFEGIPVTNMTLASEVARAKTPLVEDDGQVVRWGNPNDGFVGKMSGQPGYGVYNGPIAQLMKRYLPHDVDDLTGDSPQQIIRVLESGRPVEVWTNVYFRPVTDWVTWMSDHGPVHATFDEHAVVLVGYGHGSLYLDNPLNGDQAERVNAKLFWGSWKQIGSQAVTVKKNTEAATEQEEDAN